jgi:dihydroxyacetone kinase
VKKFINRAEDVVDEMLDGLALLHPGSARLRDHNVMVRADAEHVRQSQVAIISGGGSGHEPAHAGYVGVGMLSAAVAGAVFTSPSSDSIFAAIRAVAGAPGALLIVKNYTGDRLNFGLAAEMARAEGIPIEMLVVDDDVALRGVTLAAGARGLAGTIFVHKIVGAAAAEGRSLPELAALGNAAVKSLATMGVSFSAGTSPAVGRPSFELAEDEMELGLGIHGEPGVHRTRLESADALSEILLTEILKHSDLGAEKRVAVLVNNLGATTEMELAIVARHVVPFLESKGFRVERLYAGTFLSSLDMAGISISVLGLNDARLALLDADTTAPAWPNAPKRRPKALYVTIEPGFEASVRGNLAQTSEANNTRAAIEAACEALIRSAGELTELDRLTGDGDLGTNMERAAKAVLAKVETYPLEDIAKTLQALAETLRRELGGSSGPLYGVLFLRCGRVLEKARSANLKQWAEGIEQGVSEISELGGAHPGDRTMLDALDPFAQALVSGAEQNVAVISVLQSAARAAEAGAAATAGMKPRLGRSSYLGDRVIGRSDPGAKAAAIWLRAVADTIAEKR